MDDIKRKHKVKYSNRYQIAGRIVCEKLIPLGVIHLEKHVQAKKRHPETMDRDQLAELTIQEYQDDVHIAITSQENENK